MVDDKVLPLSC